MSDPVTRANPVSRDDVDALGLDGTEGDLLEEIMSTPGLLTRADRGSDGRPRVVMAVAAAAVLAVVGLGAVLADWPGGQDPGLAPPGPASSPTAAPSASASGPGEPVTPAPSSPAPTPPEGSGETYDSAEDFAVAVGAAATVGDRTMLGDPAAVPDRYWNYLVDEIDGRKTVVSCREQAPSGGQQPATFDCGVAPASAPGRDFVYFMVERKRQGWRVWHSGPVTLP